METRRLKLISPITYSLGRLFALLESLSLANYLFGFREDLFELRSAVKKVEVTVKRSRRIEAYVACWAALEVVAACFSALGGWAWLRVLVRVLLAYRVLEIIQSVLNVHVFTPARLHGRGTRVASLTRTFVLSFWNFLELILCFGGIYSTLPGLFESFTELYDPYYFSAVTQLTIGYGDIHPVGMGKLLAAVQGVCGFLLAAVVLSRLVAFLPQVRPVLRNR